MALMIAAACAGAWLGAGFVAGFLVADVQLGMGTALFGAATIMLLQLLNLVPGGGTALALDRRASSRSASAATSSSAR